MSVSFEEIILKLTIFNGINFNYFNSAYYKSRLMQANLQHL